MDTSELKEYIKALLKSEELVYKQEKVYDEYIKYSKKNTPQQNIKKPVCPQKPVEPQYENHSPITGYVSGAVIIYWAIMFFIFNIHNFDIVPFTIITISIVVIGVGLIWSGYAGIASSKNANNEKQKKYEIEKEQYIKDEKNYKVHLNKYNKDLDKYNISISQYQVQVKDISAKLTKLCQDARKTRDMLYAQNVIFPKYRNIVAVSSFYEYLETGRCASLEGPDGAYNLYETELRNNLIIGILSEIGSNINVLKNNQYTLYSLLQTTNSSVTTAVNTLSNIKNAEDYYNNALLESAETIKYLSSKTKK